MAKVRLFRTRSVPVPTALGSLVLLAAAALAVVGAARGLPGFLAVHDPQGHGLLVVEGWVPREALRLAADRFRGGTYDLLVVTGGPLDGPACGGDGPTYAEAAAVELRRLGIAEPRLAVVPAPPSAQDRTYRSAVSLRQWLEATRRHADSLDVLTHGPHARRSRALYRMALGDGIRVGVISAPAGYDMAHWWRHSTGAKDVLTEAIGYAWMSCCFSPGPRGSHEELWAVPDPGRP